MMMPIEMITEMAATMKMTATKMAAAKMAATMETTAMSMTTTTMSGNLSGMVWHCSTELLGSHERHRDHRKSEENVKTYRFE